MRRSFTAFLAVLMLAAVLSGCAPAATQTQTSSPAATPAAAATAVPASAAPAATQQPSAAPKHYKIAVGLADSGATMFSIMHNNIARFTELTGGEVFFQGGIARSADATVSFVENQIAAGVNGILICPPNDTVLATVKTLCEEAKVYWGICFRSILDDQIRTMVEASPYYVGRSYENESETGYGVMSNLSKLGVKKVAIISQPKGNTTSDMREEGIARACKEFGMEVVAEARNLAQASDVTAAAQSFLAAYKDLDCIYTVSTTAAGSQDAVVKAIQDAGRVGKVSAASIDFPDDMDKLFATGAFVTCSGLASWGYDPFMSYVLISNACMGTPINGESKEKLAISMPMYSINDQTTAAKWMTKFGDPNTMFYTDDQMKQLVKAWNPVLTPDTVQQMVKDFTKNIVSD